MSKHDTWVYLISPSPFDSIKSYFPKGFPVRDPFPMASDNEEGVALWIIDIERLTQHQIRIIAHLLADSYEVATGEIIDEVVENGGFGMDGQWIERMEVGAEGYQRIKELAAFLETTTNPAPEAIEEFYADQHRRWIDGEEMPPPLPGSIDEVPEQIRSEELENAIQQHHIAKILAEGGYSALDILTGKATVDILNALDPEHQYELYSDADDEED